MTVIDINTRRRAEHHRLRDPLNTNKCIRCHKHWTFTSGPHHHFVVITRWCPNCVAATLPTLGDTRAYTW